MDCSYCADYYEEVRIAYYCGRWRIDCAGSCSHERLEKNGIIKGYKAVLSGVSGSDEFEALFLKFKVTRSIGSIINAVKDFVKTFPNYLFVATIDGDWNMIIVMKVENLQKNPSSKIIEKFSDQILDYRTSAIQMKDINLLNMSLLLLT